MKLALADGPAETWCSPGPKITLAPRKLDQ